MNAHNDDIEVQGVAPGAIEDVQIAIEDVQIEELVEVSGGATAATAGTISTPATIGTAGSFSCF